MGECLATVHTCTVSLASCPYLPHDINTSIDLAYL